VKLLALVLLVACARGTMPAPARYGDRDVKRLAWVWMSPAPSAWRRSGWYRVERDDVTPLNIVVSSDDSACLVLSLVDVPPTDHPYLCRTGWRVRQRRGP
jgi:hypothetical protein